MTIIWYLVALAIIAIPFAAMVFLPINKSKPILLVFFLLFIVFMYGPMLTMGVLSLQGTTGSMTLPAKELFSFHWYSELQSTSSVMVSVRQGISKSLWLSLIVAVITAILSLTLGMAFRRAFRGSGILFYAILLSLMTPGLLLSLGLSFLLYYAGIAKGEGTVGYLPIIGVQAVWALPFGFLVMMSVFNRYDARAEEAARDLGASSVRTFREVTLPLIWTGVFGAGLFGFTLALNEFERTFLVSGSIITLPLQLYIITSSSVLRPYVYSLGVVTILISFLLIALFLVVSAVTGRKTTRAIEDDDGGSMNTSAMQAAPSGD
ncbi:MAG: ABC transporter permease subunit [Actinobacteria bacterium]|nr:ABC transporter permease subunit [Actinomycetota bacterium]